jgi:phenylpropionate dioxygenase-like ring-hydroxylating dioxygenase large terminal subunit
MVLQQSSANAWNSDDPDSFDFWEDYAHVDSRPVSSYLFEEGERQCDGRTVDASHYTDQGFFQREVERLWPHVWQMACRANDLPEVGDYLEYENAGQSVIVVRDGPGSIKAFRNACRHRGRALVSGRGNSPCFTCPFHGWGYGLDGTLQNVTASWDFEGFDQSKGGLVSCQAEVFDGWVFINLDPTAPPLNEFLGATVRRHLLVYPSENMWKAWHYGVVIPANWKVIAEAFFEVYHLARTHPNLVACAGDLQARYDSFGLHARLCSPFLVPCVVGGGDYSEQEIFEASLALAASRFEPVDEDAPVAEHPQIPDGVTARQFTAEVLRQQWSQKGLDLSAVSDAEMLDAILYQIFPNFMPFRGPAGHVAYRFRPNGLDPHSCIFEAMNLLPIAQGADLPPDAPLQMLAPGETFADYDEHIGALGLLLDQDVSNAAGIQRGLRGLKTINCAQKQEHNIVAFHHNLVSWLSGDTAEPVRSDDG